MVLGGRRQSRGGARLPPEKAEPQGRCRNPLEPRAQNLAFPQPRAWASAPEQLVAPHALSPLSPSEERLLTSPSLLPVPLAPCPYERLCAAGLRPAQRTACAGKGTHLGSSSFSARRGRLRLVPLAPGARRPWRLLLARAVSLGALFCTLTTSSGLDARALGSQSEGVRGAAWMRRGNTLSKGQGTLHMEPHAPY